MRNEKRNPGAFGKLVEETSRLQRFDVIDIHTRTFLGGPDLSFFVLLLWWDDLKKEQ